MTIILAIHQFLNFEIGSGNLLAIYIYVVTNSLALQTDQVNEISGPGTAGSSSQGGNPVIVPHLHTNHRRSCFEISEKARKPRLWCLVVWAAQNSQEQSCLIGREYPDGYFYVDFVAMGVCPETA